MNAQHSCKSAEWYTPPEWVDRVTRTLGGIDLDPASCAQANSSIVGAHQYYAKEEDGLSKPWHGTVFLNPPGGGKGKNNIPRRFWRRLRDEYAAERVPAAIYLAYSLEHLRWMDLAAGFLVAIPHKRIKFVGAGNSPTHANAFVLLTDRMGTRNLFHHEFGSVCSILWAA